MIVIFWHGGFLATQGGTLMGVFRRRNSNEIQQVPVRAPKHETHIGTSLARTRVVLGWIQFGHLLGSYSDIFPLCGVPPSQRN